MIEKEPTVTLANGETVPQSQLVDFHARNATASAERLKAAQQAAARKPMEFCPFSSAINPTCREDCALRVPQGCAIKYLFDKPPAMRSTQGKRCPISGQQCAPTCALSETGACVFTSI